MKKFISLMLIIFTVFSLSGCSNPSQAKWAEYDESPFYLFLENGFNSMYKGTSHEQSDAEQKEGWDILPTEEDFIDLNDVSAGKKPYTYSINIKSAIDIAREDPGTTYRFFTEFKKDLTIKGAQVERNGHVQNLSASETEEFLRALKQSINANE